MSTIVLAQLVLGFIIIERNKRHNELAVLWLLLLLVVPLFGVLFYFLLGSYPSRRLNGVAGLDLGSVEEGILLKTENRFPEATSEIMARLVQVAKATGCELTSHNDVMVLTNGENKFQSLLTALNDARHYIYLEYYIFREDQIGNEVVAVLKHKATSGVKVKIIVDGIGSHQLSKELFQALRQHGIEIAKFAPLKFPFFTRRVNYRNHRKIVVVDGKIGFLGGINVGDEYLGRNPKYGFWRDTHLRIEGESVHRLEQVFVHDWQLASGQDLGSNKALHFNEQADVVTQIVASGPDNEKEKVYNFFFTALNSACQKIYIETAYLIPDSALMRVLKVKALSGLSVVIIVQGIPDHNVTFWASRSFYEELLEVGVQIYEYQKGLLHAKVVMVDDQLSYVGSANIDMRSFYANFEIGAVCYSVQITKRLRQDFEQDRRDSREVKLEEFSKRSGTEKFQENIGRILAPIL